jgi:hypothetical protein
MLWARYANCTLRGQRRIAFAIAHIFHRFWLTVAAAGSGVNAKSPFPRFARFARFTSHPQRTHHQSDEPAARSTFHA